MVTERPSFGLSLIRVRTGIVPNVAFARRLRTLLLLGMVWSTLSAGALAQAGEESPTRPAVPDSVSERPRGGDAPAGSDGAELVPPAVAPRSPVRTSYGSAVDTLGTLPGVFVYDLGEPGWPDGSSRFGLPPRSTGLRFEGRPFRDPFTGRPLFELLPFELLRPVEPDRGGALEPHGVRARLRSFSTVLPRTELRFRAGSGTEQFISAGHVQQGSPSLGGRADTLQILFGYRGGSTNGVYPNADTRLRQALGRVRYERGRWQLDVTELYSSHRRGVHGGVLPRAGRASLFVPLGAEVAFPAARSRLERNDVSGRLRYRWSDRTEPVLLQPRHFLQNQTYVRAGDTLRAEARGTGSRLGQTVRSGPHRLRAEVGVSRTVLRALAEDRVTDRFTRAYVEMGDSVGGDRWSIRARGRTQWERGHALARADLDLRVGTPTLYGELAAGGGTEAPPWASGGQLAPYLTAEEEFEPSRHFHLAPRIGSRIGRWVLTLRGSVHRTRFPVLARAGDPADRAHLLQASDPVTWLEAAGRIAWRSRGPGGLRLRLRPAYRSLLAAPADHRGALASSLPALSLLGRVGGRALLFQEDLDLGVYLEGTGWTKLRGRAVHGPTALFPLAPEESVSWGPAGRLDVEIEAGIRDEATLFFTYENVLGGVGFPGVLLVPGHPIPHRTIRFGVYWPLLD